MIFIEQKCGPHIEQKWASFAPSAGRLALLVYEPGKPYPVDVYPHRRGTRTVTIRAFLTDLLDSLEKSSAAFARRKPDDALVERMDRLREKIGPIGVRVAGLVREGRRHSRFETISSFTAG